MKQSVALTEYGSLLTTQLVTVNLVQPELILSNSHAFLGASLDSIITNVGNLETWGVEIKIPSSILDQSINDVLGKKILLGKKQMRRFDLKGHINIFMKLRTDVLYPIKES